MFAELKDSLTRFIHVVTVASRATHAAVGVALLVAFLYFKIFFRRAGSFEEDLENSSKQSLLDRDYDYVDQEWSKLKILIWILLSVGCGIGAYHQLPKWFPGFFH